ncbi:MAG: hypothetical protein GAK45_00687 [Pseudomonas citronellolis]|nr:MAG: hypothetical protein GAK45_00687 [Pseudomonas citronellolis]
MRARFASPVRTLLALPLVALCAALGFFVWQTFYPVQAASGWHYRVAFNDVRKAASLVPLADGSVVASQELRNGHGSIVRLAADGTRQVLVADLSKPDGMIAAQGGWVFSQEIDGASVDLLKDGHVTALFKGADVQGLWDDGEWLYAIEDRKGDGRLLRYRWSDARLEVLRAHLTESESITRCTDGRLLYTEKVAGVIHQLTDDGRDPVILGGLNQPTYLMCDARGLWISEDSTHRARLLLLDTQGQLHTILSFLKAPQQIIADGKGGYLLAEGGRNRVLALTPDVSH